MSQVFGKNNLQDEKLRQEELKIERKRREAEERRIRILNDKSRTMGVDINALNSQADEARTKREQEKARKDLESM